MIIERKKRPFPLTVPTGDYLFENEPNKLQSHGLGITLYFKYVVINTLK